MKKLHKIFLFLKCLSEFRIYKVFLNYSKLLLVYYITKYTIKEILSFRKVTLLSINIPRIPVEIHIELFYNRLMEKDQFK